MLISSMTSCTIRISCPLLGPKRAQFEQISSRVSRSMMSSFFLWTGQRSVSSWGWRVWTCYGGACCTGGIWAGGSACGGYDLLVTKDFGPLIGTAAYFFSSSCFFLNLSAILRRAKFLGNTSLENLTKNFFYSFVFPHRKELKKKLEEKREHHTQVWRQLSEILVNWWEKKMQFTFR